MTAEAVRAVRSPGFVLMLGILGGSLGLIALHQAATENEPKAAATTAAPKQEQEHVDRHGEPLPPGAIARLGTLRFRHNDPVQAIALGPGGMSIVSAAGKMVYFWHLETGKEQRRIDGFDRQLMSVAIAHNGKLLAVGCLDGTIILWDVAANREVRRIEAHMKPDPNRQGSVGALLVQFTPDSGRLASVGADNALRLWDTATGKAVPGIGGHFHSIGRFALSPDGKTLAAITEDNGTWTIRQWDIAAAHEGKQLAAARKGQIIELAFSPDSKVLAVGATCKDWTSTIQLWDMASACNKTFSHLTGDGVVTLLAEDKPERQRVRLYDLAGEKELPPVEGHKWAIGPLSFSPDGKLLATGSNDTTVLLWDATRFKTSRGAERHLRPEQLETLWTDLGGTDAVKAYRAIRTLVAAPKASVTFLEKHLHPVAPADAKQVADLLADLDSDQFAVREKARRELEKLGPSTVSELRKLLAAKPTLEVKRAIEQLLEKIDQENLRMVRALETLELIGTPQARNLCALLADGVAEAPLTREARAASQRMAR